mmetsp:Transcript_2433/g.7101  ORF Transcript_2433/g.7101 Transcript_2433/m.7101 type:complete len:223 (-) Transcript_2433:786-1454(-)
MMAMTLITRNTMGPKLVVVVLFSTTVAVIGSKSVSTLTTARARLNNDDVQLGETRPEALSRDSSRSAMSVTNMAADTRESVRVPVPSTRRAKSTFQSRTCCPHCRHPSPFHLPRRSAERMLGICTKSSSIRKPSVSRTVLLPPRERAYLTKKSGCSPPTVWPRLAEPIAFIFVTSSSALYKFKPVQAVRSKEVSDETALVSSATKVKAPCFRLVPVKNLKDP